jgi:hypothetical protein
MKIKLVLLGVIIGVVLLMFLVFGTKLIYDSPEYEDYCDYNKYIPTGNLTDSEMKMQNEYYAECTENYDAANENYSKNMFILSLIVGVLIIIGSAVFIDLATVSGGLMFGSLMFLIYGTGSYWRYMNDWTRFFVLGVALGILIYVGYWLGNREGKKIKRKSIKGK